MRARLIAGCILAVVGAIQLAAACALEASLWCWTATAASTDGVVDRLVGSEDGGLAPIVRFTVGGRTIEWQSHSFSTPPAFAQGEAVRVLYQPDNPVDAAIDAFFSRHLPSLLIAGMGLVFAATGGTMLILRKRAMIWIAWLMEHGEVTRAEITAVKIIHSEDSTTWRIHAQASDIANNKVRTFVSQSLPFDPTPFVRGRRTVDVRVDPRRPRRYHIDLSWLPEHVR